MLPERESFEQALETIPYASYTATNAVSKPEQAINLAAILPVYQENSDDFPLVMLMRPKASKPDLPPPLFQVCKGTRMQRMDGAWQDITADKLPIPDDDYAEPLAMTALREGEEEIGLRASNIITMASVGIVPFISSSSGNCKYMALFVAAIKDPDAFDKPSETLAKTAETRWIAPHMKQALVKPDHADCIMPALQAVGFAI